MFHRDWRSSIYRSSPYALGLIVLCLLVMSSAIFWRSNDDAAMMLISGGHGIAAYPSSRLVMVNIIWGYCIQWFADIGGIPSYTWLTYLALAASYLALLYCFVKSEISHLLGAMALLIAFYPTLILPQFTLVSGYLAAAGLVLTYHAVKSGSLATGGVGLLFVIWSSLIRADETVFVIIAATPLCLPVWWDAYKSTRRMHWLTMVGIAALVFGLLQLLDYLTFSQGAWQQFASVYAARTELTDFKGAFYFFLHPQTLSGTGFSANDLHLITNWFYVDTTVYSADRLSALLSHLSIVARFETNLRFYRSVFTPFTDPEFLALLGVTALVLPFNRHRKSAVISLLCLALLMCLLLLAGRPEITRVYVPACAALLFLGVMGMRVTKGATPLLLTAAAVLIAVPALFMLHNKNELNEHEADRVTSVTCGLPRENFYLIWGAAYNYSALYRPFADPAAACPLNYYSFSVYSLAPYALAKLHQITGGSDFVPAVLSGRSFYLIANRADIKMLTRFFDEHYAVHLGATRIRSDGLISVFQIGLHLKDDVSPTSQEE